MHRRTHRAVGFAVAVSLLLSGCHKMDPQNHEEETMVSEEGHKYFAHEVIVATTQGTSRDQLAAAVQQHFGGSIVDDQSPLTKGLGYYRIQLPQDVIADEAISKLQVLEIARTAERNYVVEAIRTPNDPKFSELWGMTKIEAEKAWDHTIGSNEIVVAVSDTGVDRTHPDLVANTWVNPGETPGNGIDDDGNGWVDDIYGWDFRNNDADPMDDHGHGTHCSGTIGGTGNNAIGVTGVNWNVKIMGVKFLSASGSGSSWGGAQTVLYAARTGAKIVSASWGGGGYAAYMEDAIKELKEAGGLFVAAAGNSSRDADATPYYPMGYNVSNVVAVAASTSSDSLAYFSNYGATKVHLAAPGYGILSTTPGNGYASWSGTSMACPHVAGAAALYLSINPDASLDNLKQRLMVTCDPVAALTGKVVSNGRLNLYQLLVADSVPPAPPTNLDAMAGEMSDVSLTWSPNSEDDLAMYEIIWGTASGEYAQSMKVTADNTTARITDLDNGTTYYFAIKAVDETGNYSGPSNEVSATPGDSSAPAQVIDLTATSIEGTRASGRVESASSEASEYYAAANAYDGSAATGWISMPGTAEDTESLIVKLDQATSIDRVSLIPIAAYPEFFPVDFDIEISLDGTDWTVVGGGRGADVEAGETMDIRFPTTVTSRIRLMIHKTYEHSSGNHYAGLAEMTAFKISEAPDAIRLNFTAPGDDPGEGTAEGYDIRYAQTPITEKTFESATPIASPVPSAAGIIESVEIPGLTPETTYYFAMTAFDEEGNESEMSNVASTSTLIVPPAVITDLTVIATADGAVTLAWTATGDNGASGQAASYDLRYSKEPLTPATFEDATVVSGTPAPNPAGSNEEHTVTGLDVGDFYYFAVRALDQNGIQGGISNVVFATANGEADVTSPAAIDDLAARESIAIVKAEAILHDVSSECCGSFYEGENVIDGDVMTSWSSDYGYTETPEWVTLDLGEIRPLSKFRMLPSWDGLWVSDYPSDFDIQVSVDALNWQPLVQVEGMLGELGVWNQWSTPVTHARFVRLYTHLRGPSCATTEDGNDWYCYVEVSELESYYTTPQFDVDLTWIAPGDDDWTGTAAEYDLRHSHEPITEYNFDEADRVATDAPASSGSFEYHRMDSLAFETDHYFAVKTIDDAGNASAISNIASVTAPAVPPAPVSDLGTVAVAKHDLTLTWTATGDDGFDGTATSYDIRYSTRFITNADWDAATVVSGTPTPGSSGTTETLSVTGLDSNTTYYFAMKVIDDFGAASLLSNVAAATTLDGIAPARIEDLSASPVDPDLSGPVTATIHQSSGSYSPSTTANNLLDGDPDTIWISPAQSQVESEYVTFDLLGQKTLGRIRMLPATGYEDLFPVDFVIEVQEELEGAWTEVVSESWFEGDTDWQEWALGAVSASRVRLTVTRTNSWGGSFLTAMADVEMYEDPTDYTSLRLSWTAPGDDGMEGTATAYHLRRNEDPITNVPEFDSSTVVEGAAPPKPALSLERLELSNLTPETTYCFAIRSEDDVANLSDVSNSPCATTPGVPPSTITDLRVISASASGATLEWTAPGADGTEGQASAYHIKISSARINASNWDGALDVSDPPAPADSGTVETFEITDLEGASRYYMAIRSEDGGGNLSAISNNTVIDTADNVPPSEVTDLFAMTDESAWGTLTLTWTAPGDQGPFGMASAYDIRVSRSPINALNFDIATPVAAPEPLRAGETHTFTVTGLDPEILYYIAMKSIDDGGNVSILSNVASAETREESPVAVSDLTISGSTGDEAGNGTITIAWTAPGDDADLGTATAYDIRYGTTPINTWNFTTATPVQLPPVPGAAGSGETHTVSGLFLGKTYYFAMKTVDERGNWSEISNVASGTTPDNVAPAAVTDLEAETGLYAGSISLTWTQPGDDGWSGNVSQYDLRYSLIPIDSLNFADATPTQYQPSGGIGGTTKTMSVTELPDEITVYLAFRARDDAGNWSPVSNCASAMTPDVPPGRITDLSQVAATLDSVTISWTAPGDNGEEGSATSYNLRYSTSSITDSNFDEAAAITTLPPQSPGSSESAVLTDLDANTTYYIAIKSQDDRGNWSLLSNVLGSKTSDGEEPGTISDLTAETATLNNAVTLSWTATGDDGDVGTADHYEIRYALEPITTANWDGATPANGLPSPYSAGMSQQHTVKNLDGETEYHFAIRAVDEQGNRGAVSPSASASTKPIPPARVIDLLAVPEIGKQVTLTFTAPGDDSNEGTASSYDIRFSDAVINDGNFDSATPLGGVPTPSPAGSGESVRVTGLEESTAYWFALKTTDDVGAVSVLSTVANVTTLDETAPAAPGAVSAFSPDRSEVEIEPSGATATSELSATLGASKAIDGNEDSSWVSAGSEDALTESITLDLGTIQNVDRVKLLPDEGYLELFPHNLRIEVSEDDTNWLTVIEEDGFEALGANWMTFGFKEVSCRYIKITSADPLSSYFGLHYTVLAESKVLEAIPQDGLARLTWLAPGDDGNTGTATSYEVYMHTASFGESSLDEATLIAGAPTPATAGTVQSMDISALLGESQYFFAVRALDEAGNVGPLSEVVTTVTNDVPPGTISDLTIESVGLTEVTLSWTSPGDDGFIGQATEYEMRHATWPLTIESFPLATLVEGLPTPGISGTSQSMTIDQLLPGTVYRFALLTRDEVSAGSHLSNVVMVETDPAPDSTPPGDVTDLTAEVPISGGSPIPGDATEWTSEQGPSFLATALVDGDTETMWSSAASSSQGEEWVKIDLGEVTPSDALKLWPASGYESLFPTGIEVNVSPDGLEWVKVFSESGYEASPGVALEGEFPVTPVRYVELKVTELAEHSNGYFYAMVSELEIFSAASEPGTVLVSWTAPGDDGNTGTADNHDLRIGTCPYDHESSAQVTADDPKEAGLEERARIDGLSPGTYCIGLRTYDEAGNESNLSNVAEIDVE